MTDRVLVAKTRSSHTNLLLAAFAGAAAFLTYFQTFDFPFVPWTDAIWFLPQAVMFAQGNGLRNVFVGNYLADGAFVWHGFLFPMVLGGLFGADTYAKVASSLAVLNVLCVLVFAFALARLTSHWEPRLRLIFIGLSLLTQVGFLQGVLGRPETLSTLLISAGLLAWSFPPSRGIYIIFGILIGLSAVTSPAVAIFAAGFLGAAICARTKNPSEILGIGITLVIAALAAVLAAFYFYPYSLTQWILGIREHSDHVANYPHAPFTFRLVVQRFFIGSGRFAVGLILLVGWAIAALLLFRLKKSRPLTSFCLVVLVSLLLICAIHMALKVQFYYLLCYFPIAAGVMTNLSGIQNTIGTILRKCFLLALGFSCVDPIFLQAGRLLGYTGVPLSEARRLFAEDFKEMPGKVAVSMDLAVLSDTTERLEVLYDYVPPCDEPESDWLVAQQYCFFYSEPPTYKNFQLTKNRFAQKTKLPGRLAQWFGVNGYGYAVYKRSSPRPPSGSP